MSEKISEIKLALKNKDFTKFGEILEAEAISMHAVMMTSVPPLFYWKPETLDVMARVIELREEGLECYFTIDAGPNIHVICQKKDLNHVKCKLLTTQGINEVLINKPAVGARII